MVRRIVKNTLFLSHLCICSILKQSCNTLQRRYCHLKSYSWTTRMNVIKLYFSVRSTNLVLTTSGSSSTFCVYWKFAAKSTKLLWTYNFQKSSTVLCCFIVNCMYVSNQNMQINMNHAVFRYLRAHCRWWGVKLN